MIPTVGRIVHYKLGDYDIAELERSVERMSEIAPHAVEQIVPMVIVKVHAPDGQATEETAVNGRVFLDGRHDMWVTSRKQGTGRSEWAEPARV